MTLFRDLSIAALCGGLCFGSSICRAQATGDAGGQPVGPDGRLITTPLPDGGDTYAQKGPSPEPAPLPPSGQTTTFQYEIGDVDGVYNITPTDGDFTFQVSESFLARVLQNTRLDDTRQALVLASYPSLIIRAYRDNMDEAYPTQESYDGNVFNNTSLFGENGVSALIDQDSLAGPYVRITLTNDKGEVETFSMSRSIVEGLLANDQLSADKKIAALRSFSFPLPEEARYNFATLTQEDLARMAAKLPSVSRQEFLKMYNLYYGITNAAEAVQEIRAVALAKEVENAREENRAPAADLIPPAPPAAVPAPPPPAAAPSAPPPPAKASYSHIALWILGGALLFLIAFGIRKVFSKTS